MSEERYDLRAADSTGDRKHTMSVAPCLICSMPLSLSIILSVLKLDDTRAEQADLLLIQLDDRHGKDS